MGLSHVDRRLRVTRANIKRLTSILPQGGLMIVSGGLEWTVHARCAEEIIDQEKRRLTQLNVQDQVTRTGEDLLHLFSHCSTEREMWSSLIVGSERRIVCSDSALAPNKVE